MTEIEARAALAGAISDALKRDFPGMPVEYDNRTAVDHEQQKLKGPFVEVSVEFYGDEQASMGQNFLVRTSLTALVIINAPSGSGVVDTLRIVDTVKGALAFRQINGLNLHGARRTQVADIPGFRSEAILVPGWFDISLKR